MTVFHDYFDVAGDFSDAIRTLSDTRVSAWNHVEQSLDNSLEGAGISLTPQAKMMLLLPLMETFQSSAKFNTEEIVRSVNLLVDTIGDYSSIDPNSEYQTEMSTRAVIWSFWKKFCNIPPFCGPTTEE